MQEKLKVDRVIDRYEGDKANLISILQDVQREYNWLPQDVLTYIAQKLNLPLIDVFEVATFYKSFSLKPRGRHLITVCLGTACHVRGGQRVLEEIERRINVKPGETSEDKQFTLETVNCLGCCAIGPIVVIDGEYYGQMNTRKVASLLEKYSKKDKD
ncbi:NADH-quinone oxidoreductase subunit NuoE [Candidatus Aerophobetes bacterium]|uniref:NADH-quinone oxidoreductase subunit NuoE n=1 Tax=Aerophobetes bacterium TaxID=2030807 RepID=A0A662DA82_UNCAE|nr:MAG: NADH-quinone oxidoreductase subunit NuoE [Candidatus Aerophobetes bacterium]